MVFMASTNPARGMRDFLPADVRKREYVIGIIKSVYESRGFEPLEDIASSFGKKIDVNSKSVEANSIMAINESLDRLDIKNFAIYVSHSDVLAGILETVGVPDMKRFLNLKTLIDAGMTFELSPQGPAFVIFRFYEYTYFRLFRAFIILCAFYRTSISSIVLTALNILL